MATIALPGVLPEPDADARAASAQLSERIARRIEAAGGWVGFDAYMQAALHEPGLGYYGGPAGLFGAGGDFVTAPGLGLWFAGCVAVQLAQWFEAAPRLPRRVVEFGAGDGSLAADLLVALDGRGAAPAEYAIVELSGALRARQRDTIARRLAEQAAGRAEALLGTVRWWDALPESIEGCVIGNELLDAMPVRLFRVQGGAIHERGVVRAGEGGAGTGTGASLPGALAEAPRFRYGDRPAPAAFALDVGAALDAAMPGWREAAGDPAFDYVSEWGEQAIAWVGDIGARLAHGALLLIDYGFARAEFYHPQRSQGTLMCHRLHRAHPDPFDWPGLQDITAHVNFSAVAEAALGAGLRLAGYTTQANFLIGTGLLHALAGATASDPVQQARQLRAVQTLLSEAEMGELFKAIAFVRGIDAPAVGFARGDRSARL